MNLHGLATGLVQAVNPTIPVSVQVSDGYTTDAAGRRTAKYLDAVCVQGQVQPLTWRDLQQLDGLNLQGTRRKIYLYARIDGIVRSENKGGDLVTITQGVNAGTWLVSQVLEQWPDWVVVACTLQNE